MKKIYPPRHTVGIAISKQQHSKLKRLAKKEHRSVSSLIRALVETYLTNR